MKNINFIENSLLRPKPDPVITIVECDTCWGTGVWIKYGGKPEVCPDCGGQGEVEIWT